MYHHSFELSFRYRNHTLISHNFLIRTYWFLLTCIQLPRSLVQNLQPSKLLRSVTSIGNEDNDKLVFGGQTPIDVLNHLPIAKRTRSSGGYKKKDDANNKLLLVFPFNIEDAMLSEAASGL
jgi:hypothetical protein